MHEYTQYRLEATKRALQLLREQIALVYHPNDAVELKLSTVEVEVSLLEKSIQKQESK
jgi:hypothetical protein